MKNKLITSVLFVAVLCITISFSIMHLPIIENTAVVHKDFFEQHSNYSDVYTSDSKSVIISTEDLVETYTSEQQNVTASGNETTSSDSTDSSVIPPSSSSTYEYSHNSFFDEDDDIFDNQDYEKEVYVSIKGIDDYLAKGYVSFESGDTVFDVTKDLLDKNNIELKRRGAGTTLYIYKIGDLEEKDHGPLSGWVYTVNDERINAGCGSYKVDIGDVIDWKYQKD